MAQKIALQASGLDRRAVAVAVVPDGMPLVPHLPAGALARQEAARRATGTAVNGAAEDAQDSQPRQAVPVVPPGFPAVPHQQTSGGLATQAGRQAVQEVPALPPGFPPRPGQQQLGSCRAAAPSRGEAKSADDADDHTDTDAYGTTGEDTASISAGGDEPEASCAG